MIHGLKLPLITHNRLNDVVLLQLFLLYHAASTPTINAHTCERFLSHKKFFQGRSKKIVDWLWQPGTTKRHKHLKNFASSFEAKSNEERDKEQQTKIDWCLCLLSEAASLYGLTYPPLEVMNFFGDDNNPECDEKNAPNWKREAKCFLLYFYSEYLQTNKKFPVEFFSDPEATEFGRQDILAAFLKENQHLEVCAFCDESRYYTQDEKSTYTSLDHYFPKSHYPHFACHPYNLIPTCPFCNSSIKGEHDPFIDTSGRRRTLSKYSLPYRNEGRGHDSYLEVSLGRGSVPFEITKIRPRKDNAGNIDPEIYQAIEILTQVHNIPGRWITATEIHKISETLYRRMRQFFCNGQNIPPNFDMSPIIVYDMLKRLLYYINEEDRQRDPFAFAMTWMLVALINDELRPFIEKKPNYSYSVLWEEIIDWFGQNPVNNTKQNMIADSLLAIPSK